MKKIGFITDTNIIRATNIKGNFYFDSIDFFLKYIDNLKILDKNTNLIYYMPEIVLKELYYQTLDYFNEDFERLCNIFKKLEHGIGGKLPKNRIELVLKKETQKYKEKLKIIKLNYSKKNFNKLVEDALAKNPPFDKSKTNQKTDSGYKDALIWLSILNNSDIDECEKIYFFSGDKIFSDNEKILGNEFKKAHPNVEIIIKYFPPSGSQRQNCLETIIEENNLIKTDIIKLYNKELIRTFIQSINYKNYNYDVLYQFNNIVVSVKDINFTNFDTKDFYIDNVLENKEIKDSYIVKVNFNTLNYSLEENIAIPIKERILGNITLYLNKNNSSFNLLDYKINNVHFLSTYFKNLSNTVAEIINNSFSFDLEKLSNPFEDIQNNIINPFSSELEKLTDPFKNIQNNIIANPFSSSLEKLTNPFGNIQNNIANPFYLTPGIHTPKKKFQKQIQESSSSLAQLIDNTKDNSISNYLNTDN